jgi:hypothetical protein
LLLKQSSNAQTIFLGYTAITPVGNNTLNFGFSTGSGVWKNFTLSSFLLTDNINRTYTLPDASGTIALVGGSGVGTVTSVSALTLGTSGTDLSSSVANETTTPVITLNVPTASAANRGALSAADWTTFNGKQDNIVAGTTAQYYRGDKTFQTLNTAAVPELTNLYYTEARVSANTDVAANTAARHNAITLGTANGLSLSTQELSLGLASSSANGALSSTDWTTFNNKQNALTNPVTGTGTANYLPKFTGTSTIGNSTIFDNGGNIGINNTNSYNKLDIVQVGSNNAVTGVGLKIVSDAGNSASMAFSQSARGTATIGMQSSGAVPSNFVIGTDVTGSFLFKKGLGGTDLSTGTTQMNLDSSGNLGLGVTPSAWNLSFNVMQVGTTATFYGRTSGIEQAGMASNTFFASATNDYRYLTTAQASYYLQSSGIHYWLTAPSGTAGNAITFTQAMTLGSNSGLSIGTLSAAPSQGLLVQGNVGIGTGATSPATILHLNQASSTIAITLQTGSNYGYLFNDGTNIGLASNVGSTGLKFLVNRSSPDNSLVISSTGAATFSSSVTANYISSIISSSSNASPLILQNNAGWGSTQITSISVKDASDVVGAIGWKYDGVANVDMLFHSLYNGAYKTVSNVVMTVKGTGNVGFNTATPANSTGFTTLSINGSTGGQIEFKTGDAGKAYIYSNSTDLRFYTGGGTFRFENTTGLEVGYSAAQGLFKLDVNGTGRFRNSSVGGAYYGQLIVEQDGEAAINIKGVSYSSIYFGDAANHLEGGIVYDHSTNNLELRGSGNSADLTITSGGNVLIGTETDNGHKLQLSTSSTSKTTFSINNTSANKTFEIGVQGSSGTLPNRFYIFDDDRNAFLFTITSGGTSRFHAALETIELTSESTTKLATISGNVLIGTDTDTSDKLRVNGNTYTNTIRTHTPDLETRSVAWKLGASRGGTVTTNATVRVEIDGVLVDLVARYV